MDEFIMNCIQSGAYSAVFAVLLVYIVRSNIKREGYYRRFIGELCASLKEIHDVSGKLDGLIELAEKSAEKKKKPKPDFGQAAAVYAASAEVSLS